MDLSQALTTINNKEDPSCINQFFEYYEQVYCEDSLYVENMVERLAAQDVYWEQPWYQKEKGQLTIKSFQSIEEDEDSEKQNSNFVITKFTEEERQCIRKNWKELIQTYNLADEPERIARFKFKKDSSVGKKALSKSRYFFTAWLAKGLKRNLQQVYTNFVKMYAYEKTGKYTGEEIKVIDLVMYHCENIDKCVRVLAVVLGRQERHIRNRRNISIHGKEEAVVKKTWNLVNATKLVKKLLKYTGLELNDLKDHKISYDIWKKMENSMENKAVNLHHFWYRSLHVQLFAQKTLRKYKIYKKIIKLLLESKWRSWTDIDWQSLVIHFPEGVTKLFLYEILTIHIRNKVDFKAPLAEILQKAIEVKDGFSKKSAIRRLAYCPETGLYEIN